MYSLLHLKQYLFVYRIDLRQMLIHTMKIYTNKLKVKASNDIN